MEPRDGPPHTPTRSARSGERGGPRHPDIADRALIRNGLFGFNGVLTGIELSVFLQWDWHVAVYTILGAIVSTIVMMGLTLLISWDMAPLTAPFVLTAWLLLFAVYQFGQLHPTKLIGPN